MKRLVIGVLEQELEPLLPAQIEHLIEAKTGERIARSSIKNALRTGSRREKGPFVRVANGYVLRNGIS